MKISYSYILKRIFESSLAAVLIILLLPIMLITALLIAICMGRPVLFKQLRAGYLGKPFNIYKFRTMSNSYDHNQQLLDDEVRLTKLGRVLRKYSLDELPQLFNVLIGQLSFVGPRPLLMEYLPLYSKEQARRHEVKPGITGWAQVNGRNAISWEERFKLDVWYVDNQSLRLDYKILLMTVLTVLSSRGVNHDDKVSTMPKFSPSKTSHSDDAPICK